MDVYTSEKKLHQMQAISSAISYLKEHKCVVEDTLQKPKGHTVDTYEERRQLLFKATDYGDDMDRPLQKENGEWTYFAGDIAYHFNKIERGFDTLIDILGADHSGYVKRIKACVSALLKSKNGQNNEIDLDAVKFDVKVCQMVNFVDQGKPVRMSKRSGNFITLSDVLEKVEKDSVRYMMVSRHNDMGIDFDFSIVLDQSKDNPIFYIQYAHARICSVFRHAVLLFPDASTFFVDCGVSGSLPDSLFDLLTEPLELLIIKHLSAWPRRVFVSYQSLEPHRIAHFMYDIAGLFHSLWNKGRENAELRFLDAKNKELTFARLALLFAIKTVIVNGLSILGMEPSQKM
jgi:arginyl-tRNA synthetase